MAIKTQLILGNGFDKYLGLSTSYDDYFQHKLLTDSDYSRFLEMLYKAKISDTYDAVVIDDAIFLATIKELSNYFSMWDAYFVFLFWLNNVKPFDENAFGTHKKWSDVESQINRFLRIGKKDEFTYSNVANTLIHEVSRPNYRNELLLSHGAQFSYFFASFLFRRMSEDVIWKFSSKNCYEYALNELKLFERNFSNYIVKLEIENPTYEVKALKFVDRLVSGLNESTSIETFNFTKFHIKENVFFRNIHGEATFDKSGIFGIDGSSFGNEIGTNDPRYIFTKTYREVELGIDGNKPAKVGSNPKNIVVFGHSLNEQDQSYFFDSFDAIDLADAKGVSTITFAYCIFDENKKTEIKKDKLLESSGLINRYQDIRLPSVFGGSSGRLLSTLEHSGRIKFLIIPKL